MQYLLPCERFLHFLLLIDLLSGDRIRFLADSALTLNPYIELIQKSKARTTYLQYSLIM